MPALITLGRVLFALPFIYSGATKLFGIQPTTDFIGPGSSFPPSLFPTLRSWKR